MGAKQRKRHAAVAPRQHKSTTNVKNPSVNWQNRREKTNSYIILNGIGLCSDPFTKKRVIFSFYKPSLIS